jgi:hypothetical protein
MSPHDTNPKKEARRHAVPLVTLAVLLMLVALGFILWIWNATEGPDETQASPVEEQPVTEPAE